MRAYTQCFVIAVLLLVISVPAALASLDCNDCHGTSVPADNRPVDDSFRNLSTGGFQGSHRTHMGSSASATSCGICHPGSNSFTSSHREGLIKVSSHVNSSPLTTLYKNSTSAWSQTATPTMGTCTNVNCHFETVTPVWGSDSSVATCTTCHGVPPAGAASAYSGGAAGSHAIHNVYYPGISNCIKCHSDHTVEAAPFAHAADIGTRAIIVAPRDPLNNIYGSFSAGTRDYLPSQVGAHTYGTCKNTYCHSTVQADGGTGAPAYGSPTWGASLSSCNTTCHGVGGHGNSTNITTGSHTKHLAYNFGLSSPDPKGNCTTCHHWPTVSTPVGLVCAGCHTPHNPVAGSSPFYPEIVIKHVNGLIEVAFNAAFTNGSYKNGTSVPRSGYSSCANTYCHSDGTSVATGTVTANTSPTWGSGTMTCSGCHGNPPAYANNSPKKNSHVKHAGLGYGCNTCHAGTTADGTTIASTALHVNKSYNLSPGAGVSFTYVFGITGGTCSNISCHNNGTAVWGATLTCGDCHAVSPGGD